MTLEEAIKVMDVNMCGESSNVSHAWDVISAILVESTNSSHNSESAQCKCGNVAAVSFCQACYDKEAAYYYDCK